MGGLVGIRHVAGILLVLVAGWAWVWVFDRPAHAETVGYRIEVRACRGADCRLLPVSKRRWVGQFACQGHAGLIERFGDAPRGRTLSARCVAVVGLAGA
ncbi:hypothetical protein [Methylobacterium sp. NEAU K]|uniref:hypothetical protein n=1 Tax=Methylobacterium sp. NEAU K TaxID=3064946 RepID=UPI0027365A7D|nr:hypothetical protein [Methylobacterium sp. NEAU K]MDP4005077.1 hypothetical protein [Methylobacterium sp. NEAU K]